MDLIIFKEEEKRLSWTIGRTIFELAGTRRTHKKLKCLKVTWEWGFEKLVQKVKLEFYAKATTCGAGKAG